MRKAAISIGSNISEGCGYASDRAFLSYLHQSLGSAHELEFQCRVSIKLALGNSTKLTELLARIGQLKRQIARLIVSIRGAGGAKRRG